MTPPLVSRAFLELLYALGFVTGSDEGFDQVEVIAEYCFREATVRLIRNGGNRRL
jgi:hypothetical protein